MLGVSKGASAAVTVVEHADSSFLCVRGLPLRILWTPFCPTRDQIGACPMLAGWQRYNTASMLVLRLKKNCCICCKSKHIQRNINIRRSGDLRAWQAGHGRRGKCALARP
jgi:hypothetical protein